MKNSPKIGLLLLLLLLARTVAGQQQVYTVATVPDPKNLGGGYVSDPDGFLPPPDVTALNNVLKAIEDSTSAQVAIVVVGSIGQEDPKEFATNLFAYWGIGYADTDNGLLILSVMDQRRTEFETGYGMEAVLTDAECYRIGMQELVPHFRAGQYSRGLLAVVNRVRNILENPAAAADIRSDRRSRSIRAGEDQGVIPGIPLGLEIYLLITLLFHLILLMRVISIMNSKQDLYDKFMAIRKWKVGILIVLFPLLYILAWFLLKQLLKKLRYHPRFSKVNGKPMRVLTEDEEDPFLSQGQITEEEIGSVDYDVWITPDEDDVLILRYKKPFTRYSACPKCGFVAYFHARTNTLRAATYNHSGQKEELYECKNCAYRHRKTIIIPKKVRSSGSGGSGGFGGGGGSSSWGGGSSGGGGAGVSW